MRIASGGIGLGLDVGGYGVLIIFRNQATMENSVESGRNLRARRSRVQSRRNRSRGQYRTRCPDSHAIVEKHLWISPGRASGWRDYAASCRQMSAKPPNRRGRRKISQIFQFSLDANIGSLVEMGKRARGCCGCRRNNHEVDTVPEYLPEEFFVRKYSRSEVVREGTEEWSNAKS